MRAGIYDRPELALGSHLQELHDILLAVLEAAEMSGTRASLIESWCGFTSQNGGLQNTLDDNEYQNCVSPALDAVERIIEGLQMSVTQGISSEEFWTLSKLEEMLWNTAALAHFLVAHFCGAVGHFGRMLCWKQGLVKKTTANGAPPLGRRAAPAKRGSQPRPV